MLHDLLRRGSLAAILALAAWPALGDDWKPANGPLMTRWSKDVKADAVLPEYPRPQLVRADWQNLNGLWQLGFGKMGDAPPVGKTLDQQILVPFPVESALSGVMKHNDRLWYRRMFAVPQGWSGRNVLLHFGAVDWESTVWVNGKELGTHRGGYDGFSFDITDALKPGAENELIVRVFDPTDAGTQPRGKQVNKPGGIFYMPTTGIWQTVWLEPVAPTHITRLKVTTAPEDGSVNVIPTWTGEAKGETVTATILDGTREVATFSARNGEVRYLPLKVPGPAKLWTPETPFLYGLKVELKQGDKVVDAVESYFRPPQDRGRQGRKRGQPGQAQRQADLHGRPARPGVLARWALYGTDRRSAQI